VKEIGYFEWAHREALNRMSPGWGDRILRSNRARFPTLEERIAKLRRRAGDDPAKGTAAEAQIARLRGFIDRFGRDDNWYRDLFEAGAEDWAIDSTPSYGRLPEEAIRHMASLAEEVRVVLVLREPAARLRSLMQHNRRQQSRRVAMEPGRAVELIRERESPYVQRIGTFREALGPERLSILFFEDLIREREPATATLLATLNLPPEPALFEPEPAPNASHARAFDRHALLALAAHSERYVAEARAFLGSVPPEWTSAAGRLHAEAAEAAPTAPPLPPSAPPEIADDMLVERAREQLARREAAHALDTLDRLDDRHPVKRLLLARAYLGLGRRDEARASLAGFLAEQPDHPAARALWTRAFG
jgi:hypothetical protein